MRVLRHLIAMARVPFRRDGIADEIREEMRFHLEMREQELRSRGLAAGDAKRAASERFGDLTVMQDRGYRIRGGGVMESVIQDARYAGRMIARQPRFSAIVILTIALAMGVSTSLFSIADATLLRPLPFPDPDRIVEGRVQVRFDGRLHFGAAAMTDMRRWQQLDVFSALAAWNDANAGSILDGPVPQRVEARDVTDGYLAVHAVAPVFGRGFTQADLAPGAPPVIMLSHAYWQTHLGADRGVMGRLIRYDDVSAELVGVLPPRFYPEVTLWRPLRTAPARADARGYSTEIYGRLRPNLNLDDAARRLSAITPVGEGRSAFSATEAVMGAPVRLTSILDETSGRYRTIVQLLGSAVGFLVLIACVNVAGLLLARGPSREAELAIRASIGAGRLRLIRQLLIESISLSAAGAFVGVVIAWLSLDGLVSILPTSLPPGSEATMNLRVLAGIGALAVVTGIAFGLIPAIRLSGARIGAPFGRRTPRFGAALSRRGGQSLIAAEVALGIVLVIGAGLMIRSFVRLTSVDIGFDPDNLVAFKAVPVEMTAASQARYYPALLDAIRALPVVDEAGAVDHFALAGTSTITGVVVGGKSFPVAIRQVLPGYFEAMGLPLRQGRFPSAADNMAAGFAVVLNESAARRLFPDGAIGRDLTFRNQPLTVSGVVADFYQVLHGGPTSKPEPEVFLPFDPTRAGSRLALGMTIVVRPRPGAINLIDTLRRTTESIGPRAIVEDARPGSEWLDDLVAVPRHRTALLTLLGAFGLTLTLVGVFSTTAYAVARRTREIGVRMALGAQPIDVVSRMVREAGSPLILGLAAGLGVAYYATRVVESFLFQTTPHDPATFAAVAVLMGTAALVAAWIPARRAALVDPVTTLRTE
jgi:putative ABC transport system permease protein